MRILFLCHRIPYPPNKGDKIRSFHILEYLARRHKTHLVCLIDDPRDIKYVDNLRDYCDRIDYDIIAPGKKKLQALINVFSNKPLSIAYFDSGRLRTVIAEALRKESYDVVFVYSSGVAGYVDLLERIPRVIDFVDVDSQKWSQYAKHQPFPASSLYALEASRLSRFERYVARHFDYCLFSSKMEQSLFMSMTADVRTDVIENGVDLDFFAKPERFLARDLQLRRPYVVFTGAMDYYPNVDAVLWFAKEIFPLVRREVPDVNFYVVGNNPTRRVRRLADGSQGIFVTGYVEDVRPYLWNASAFVAPFRIAQGVLNKVLEAMAAGVPVVATPEAVRGFNVHNGKHLLMERSPSGFGLQMVTLLRSPDLHNSLRNEASDYVSQAHDWATNLRRLEDLLVGLSEDNACCIGAH